MSEIQIEKAEKTEQVLASWKRPYFFKLQAL